MLVAAAIRLLHITPVAVTATLLFLPGLWKLAFFPVYALVLGGFAFVLERVRARDATPAPRGRR